jgi:hypothetical protein
MDNIDERVQLKKSSIDLKNEMASLTSERLRLISKNSNGNTPRNIRTPGGVQQDDDTSGICEDLAPMIPDVEDDDVSCEDENLQDSQFLEKLSERMNELRSRKRQIDRRISDNEATMQSLQAELPSRVKDEDVCAFLSLLYRNQVLEIEAMDRDDQLDLLHRHNDQVMRHKHEEIDLLRNQIRIRDGIIQRVRACLTGDVQEDIQDLMASLVNIADVESPETPSLPYSPFRNSRNPIAEVVIVSPTGVPLSSKIKGIGESILTSVKNSPRFHSRKDDACNEHSGVSQNLSDISAIPPLPLSGAFDPSPVKRGAAAVNNKKIAAQSVRSTAVHELSVQGVGNNMSHPISTRRAKLTDRPSGSKQQARAKHHAPPMTSKLRK